MNKADLALVATLAAPALSHRAAREVVDAIFSEIAGAVTHGERVIITGFGAFSRVEREGRLGRNPRTGEPVPIAAMARPRFTPGEAFRAAVADADYTRPVTQRKAASVVVQPKAAQ